MFIAEPVGSCTDLVATVTYPLRRIYGDRFTIAPLSVLLDPQRALRVFGLAEGRAFSDKVTYIYRKQLEEADFVIINKCDTVPAAALVQLGDILRREFPHCQVLTASARHGDGLDEWFSRLLGQDQVARRAIDVDYDIYAEGEARLGWLNATIQLEAPVEFDANAVLAHLARDIQARLVEVNGEVAHLKMTFSPDGGLNDIAAVNLVRSDFIPELSQRLDHSCTAGQLILNLRAEAAPDILKTAVESSLSLVPGHFHGVRSRLDHLEHFRPGRPQPTHRLLAPT